VEAEPTFDISNDCLSRYISWAGIGGNIRNASFIKRVNAFSNSWIKCYSASNSWIKWFMLLPILGSNGLCSSNLGSMVYASSNGSCSSNSWIYGLCFFQFCNKMVYASSTSWIKKMFDVLLILDHWFILLLSFG
jgi:hypothetical protein